jgi:hypothetical protein
VSGAVGFAVVAIRSQFPEARVCVPLEDGDTPLLLLLPPQADSAINIVARKRIMTNRFKTETSIFLSALGDNLEGNRQLLEQQF